MTEPWTANLPRHTMIRLDHDTVVTRTQICGTRCWVYTASKRLAASPFEAHSHSTISRPDDDDQAWYGQMGTEDLTPETNAIPVGPARFAACDAERADRYAHAYGTILLAFPEAGIAKAKRDMGEIEIWF